MPIAISRPRTTPVLVRPSFEHSALGDIRIEGMYTGFSDDMSTGVRFGVKLASGDFTYSNFDRDTRDRQRQH